LLGPARHSRRPHQRHCGTRIWPDRDIAGCSRETESPARLCRPGRQASRAHPRGKPGFWTFESGCGRETDSLLEGTGFEPSVPLLRKALLGVANRRRRHERRSHLQVQVRNGNDCLEWLPTALPFAQGPRVRIRFPPAASQRRTPFGTVRFMALSFHTEPEA